MLRTVSLSTFILGITTILNYATFVIFARTASADLFSQYLYDLTIAGALSILINYGSQRVYTRDVIETRSEQRSFNTLMTVRITLGSMSLLGMIVWSSGSQTASPLAAVFLVYHIFQLNFLFEYFSKPVELAVITLIEKTIFSLTSVIWTLTIGFTWHVYGFFLLSTLFSIALQAKKNNALVLSYKICSTPDIVRYFKRYYTLVLIDVSQLTYGNFSRLIIQQKNGLLDFGIVSIGFQIIKVASIFQTQVEYIFRPETIRLAEAGNTHGLRKHSLKYLYITTLPTIVGSISIILLARPLISILFGEQYIDAVPALQVLSILPVIVNLMRFVEMIYIGLNLYKTNLIANLLACLMLIVILTLIPAGTPSTVFLWSIVVIQTLYACIIALIVIQKLKFR